MTSSFPQPSFTLGGSNENKTTLQSPQQGDKHYPSLALAPATKDPSSPPGVFGARSPLKSLPENDSGFGLRQRRGMSPNDVYDKAPSALSNETMSRAPPRASLTMSMGSKTSSMAPTTAAASDNTSFSAPADIIGRSDELWILVFGFTNERQYEDIMEKFKKVDNIVEAKGGPPKNWVAIRYDSAIAVEKALCNSPCVVSGGCVCGATRLPNSQKFFQSQQQQHSSTHETTGKSESKKGFLNTNVGSVKEDGNDDEQETHESDIYMSSKEDADFDTKKNICERFMGWLYGW